MKKITALLLILILTLSAFAITSCSGSKTGDADASAADAAAEVESAETGFDNTPHAKADGSKHRIAYVDYDEYLPASRQLYYILSGLEELGWIKEGSLPFDMEKIESSNMSTKDMYAALSKAELGDYLEFVGDAFYYMGYDDPDSITKDLKARAGKEIDLVITFGTSAGALVSDMGLSVPMIDFSATDPVASGIINRTEGGSGKKNVWAQVEPSVPLRQLKYYYSIKPFDNLGVIIYGDETISGVPDIRKSAAQNGFSLTKYNIEEQPRETEEELAAYYDLVEKEIKKIVKEDIDAFFLTIDLVNDYDQLPRMLKPFYDKGIPVYMMDDLETVKRGGTMLILASDLENVGRFIADATAKILNGAAAETLECTYTSSPGIYLNYKVAKQIGYPLDFELLSACDEIYTGE